MNLTTSDPTAGERARAIWERRTDPRVTTDPTAGEHARLIRAMGAPPITDPTDPACGLLLDSHRDVPKA